MRILPRQLRTFASLLHTQSSSEGPSVRKKQSVRKLRSEIGGDQHSDDALLAEQLAFEELRFVLSLRRSTLIENHAYRTGHDVERSPEFDRATNKGKKCWVANHADIINGAESGIDIDHIL